MRLPPGEGTSRINMRGDQGQEISAEKPDIGRRRRLILAWGTLAVNLVVILWGAFVRATGSGAGCGNHWPLCNGEIVPRAPALATVIEFSHRLSSGLALLLVVGLVVAARGLPRGALYRKAAWVTLGLMLSEALIGAGLVLLEYVADDLSLARGWWMSAHLINTFFLMAALTLSAFFAGRTDSGQTAGQRSNASAPSADSTRQVGVAILALGAVLMLGVSGAITALGDTLFPVTTLEEGRALTFSPDAHLFVRLRVWHPILACVVGVIVVLSARVLAWRATDPLASRFANFLVVTYVLQLLVGLLNVRLLAPVWIQLLHLLLADLIWILLVLLVARVFWPATGAPGSSLERA